MRRIHYLALPAIVVFLTLGVADSASAGEPFHPIQPIVDILRWFGGWF